MMAMVIDPDAWFILVNPASGGGRAARFRPRLVDSARARRPAVPLRRECGPRRRQRAGLRAPRTTATGACLPSAATELSMSSSTGCSRPACRRATVSSRPRPGEPATTGRARWRFPTMPTVSSTCMARAAVPPGRHRHRGGPDAAGGSAFHNVAGAGLDAEVIRRTPQRGPRAVAYLLGLVRTLATYRAPEFNIAFDGNAVRGRFLLALASIGPRCGGGMRLTPDAVVDDGWLDMLTIDPLGFGGALTRLPRLFDGRLGVIPRSTWSAAERRRLTRDPPCGVEARRPAIRQHAGDRNDRAGRTARPRLPRRRARYRNEVRILPSFPAPGQRRS